MQSSHFLWGFIFFGFLEEGETELLIWLHVYVHVQEEETDQRWRQAQGGIEEDWLLRQQEGAGLAENRLPEER